MIWLHVDNLYNVVAINTLDALEKLSLNRLVSLCCNSIKLLIITNINGKFKSYSAQTKSKSHFSGPLSAKCLVRERYS